MRVLKTMVVLWLCTLVSLFLTPSQATSLQCENPPLDIVLVIDMTQSLGIENYRSMLESIKTLISGFDIGEDQTHFAIVTFGRNAKVRVSLNDPKSYSQQALKEVVHEMKEGDVLENQTRTDKAVKIVGEEVFTKENGDRPSSPNVMILFTDGKTHKDSEPYESILPTLEEKGVHRIAVGIGKNIKPEELEIIAGDNSRVINATNFADLNNKLNEIREVICNIDGGYTEWSGWSSCSVTCGGSVRFRFRTCTNPPPENDGKTCIEGNLGPPRESEACGTQECPTPEPPPEPTPPAPCKENLDIGVVIDSSGSIKPDDYQKVKDYVTMLAKRMEISKAGTHMAILFYSFEAYMWYRFTDVQTVAAIKDKIEALPHIRGRTRTDKALELAAKDFFGWQSCGDRPDKPNVLIVLTDGKTNPDSKPLGQVTPSLDEANVRRIAIGIGKGVDDRELEQIASRKDDVLHVANYQELHAKLEDIMNMACEDQYPGDCGSWGEYGPCSKTCGGGVEIRVRSCPAKSLHLTKQKRRCHTDLCPGQECIDRNPYLCRLYANRGRCSTEVRVGFSRYSLKDYCKLSCKQCTVGGGGGGGAGKPKPSRPGHKPSGYYGKSRTRRSRRNSSNRRYKRSSDSHWATGGAWGI